jgi:5-methylcytosine-specific restriction endonuclease McrA
VSRRGLEFSTHTQDEAIKQWHIAHPDEDEIDLEVHHRVPIAHAKKMKLPPSLVRSGANAEALTKSEHYKKKKQTEEESKTIAQALFGLLDELF